MLGEPARSLLALLTADVVARFRAYVDQRGPDDCWPWMGSRDGRGYGRFHSRKPFTSAANRVALVLKLGRDLAPGMFACHTCDNPPCCNPAHLYEGTHQQNVDDKVSRDRQQKGEDVPSAILTAEAVVLLRERFAHGDTITSLADEFGIALGTASKAINGKTWAHVGGPIRIPGQRGRRPSNERINA